MRTFWLIRHGESESNAGLPVIYPHASVLTATGVAQAHCISQAFTRSPDLIVSSPYKRAEETALPTRERFPDVPYEVWPVQEFTHISVPQGHLSTLAERKPLADAYWERCDPWYCDGERAESFSSLIDRVSSLYSRLRERDEAFIAIFSHGMFIRAMTWSLLGGPGQITVERMHRFRHFITAYPIFNGAIYPVAFEEAFMISTPMIDHLPSELILSRTATERG
jgi:broad specificity phosphatase PhoE